MPHGYKCDRCETFVDHSQETPEEPFPLTNMSDIETVEVSAEVDGDANLHSYTICPVCRWKLVRFVEEGHA